MAITTTNSLVIGIAIVSDTTMTVIPDTIAGKTIANDEAPEHRGAGQALQFKMVSASPIRAASRVALRGLLPTPNDRPAQRREVVARFRVPRADVPATPLAGDRKLSDAID
jgi:hypothetical protein